MKKNLCYKLLSVLLVIIMLIGVLPVYAADSKGTVKVENNPTEVIIEKLISGSETPLSGAFLQVVSVQDGTVIDTWESNGTPHIIKRLEIGYWYTLKEISAPYGYYKAKDINFKLNEDGKTLTINDEVTDSNVIKMYDTKIPIININFTKEIVVNDNIPDEDTAYKIMKLDPDAEYLFNIILTNKDTGDIINGILNNKKGLSINNLPIGAYYIEEFDDNYFDFQEMTATSSQNITFEKQPNGKYLLNISDTITEDITINILVKNILETERYYEDKDEKENIFYFFPPNIY